MFIQSLIMAKQLCFDKQAGIESELIILRARVQTLERRNEGLETKVQTLEHSVQCFEKKCDDLEERVEDLERINRQRELDSMENLHERRERAKELHRAKFQRDNPNYVPRTLNFDEGEDEVD